MTIDRGLFALVILLGSCVSQPDTAADPSVVTTADPVVAAPAEFCEAALCSEINACPECPGETSTCGPGGTCVYSVVGGGGGGGGGGPFCDAAICNDASDCVAACPAAVDPRCLGNVCFY